MTATEYEGWYYNHRSPWMKITANVGDGNTMNSTVIMEIMLTDPTSCLWKPPCTGMDVFRGANVLLEQLTYYYGMAGIDNDGDGLIDEDGWDGVDNDGDCLSLNASAQDSNGDGIACGPGDLGVDEDFSEQFITDMVNTREIYLIPMLNTDGVRYDMEEYCGSNSMGKLLPQWLEKESTRQYCDRCYPSSRHR